HHDVRGNAIANALVQAKRLRPARLKLRSRPTVSASEQRDIVTKGDKRVTKICHDPLRAAIELRRHGLHQWRNLRDLHGTPCSPDRDPILARQPAMQHKPCWINANRRTELQELYRHSSTSLLGRDRWFCRDQTRRLSKRIRPTSSAWSRPASALRPSGLPAAG